MPVEILSSFSRPFIVAVCAFIALVVYEMDLLTGRAAFSAFVIAVFIWIFQGVEWLLVLLTFFVIGSAATKWRYGEKEKEGTAEARKGRRSVMNVMGSAYSPLLFVVFSSPVGFLASVSAALADTLASEMGTVSRNVRLITTMEKVDPGTNGGVSLFGLFVSLIGAALMASTSVLLGVTDPSLLVLIVISGFAGSLFDSLLGATLERSGKVSKIEVNVASTLFAGLLVLSLIYLGAPEALAPYMPVTPWA